MTATRCRDAMKIPATYWKYFNGWPQKATFLKTCGMKLHRYAVRCLVGRAYGSSGAELVVVLVNQNQSGRRDYGNSDSQYTLSCRT